MDTQRIDGVIAKLAGSADLQKVLEQSGETPEALLEMLATDYGRRQVRALAVLARLHRRLLADRWSPFAVHKLAQLLGDEKSEVRLKGALALLGATRRTPAKGAGRKGKPAEAAPELPELNGTETAELMEAVSEVLTRWRKERE
jgi:hypothetical protein